MNQTHWLVYYKQRQYGREHWAEANAVTDLHPVEFLARLRNTPQGHESLVMWAMEAPQEMVDGIKDLL